VISVMVFTRDLRVADNPALAAAVSGSAAVVPLFVVDDEIVMTRFAGHVRRLGFLLDSLKALDASLRGLGGYLVVRRGPWPDTVLEVASSAGAGAIHLSADVSGYAARRLARLRSAAASARIGVTTHPGVTIVAPGAIHPTGAPAYRVFTPYYRRWLAADWRPEVPPPPLVRVPPGVEAGRVPDLNELCRGPVGAWPAGGEPAGLNRLRSWSATEAGTYAATRDDLAGDRTSRLSPYLRFGCISPLSAATELATGPGTDAVVRQLAWRDFFGQLLAACPEAGWADFRKRGDTWVDDLGAFQAWQAGQTGYPVVDAGLRQLRSEGFMPGRARMVAASFLTKDLGVDWRLGAAHFLEHLVDGDIACNQLNWQWAAGTGTDTRPGRMLNPARQGRRHDPSGDYVRRWVPELAHLPAGVIHDPSPKDRRAAGYPDPVTNHRAAMAVYRATRRSGQRAR
jgi:deoxyribodipyrimidine photo-lyase